MKKRRVVKKSPDVIKQIIDMGLGDIPFSKLGDLAKVFQRELTFTLYDANGKKISSFKA